MKKFVILIALCLVCPFVGFVADVSVNNYNVELPSENQTIVNLDNECSSTDGPTYWALMIAVGIYANNPDMDRPSMFQEIDNLYNTLLVSEQWKEDHIRVITAENATLLNILRGFRWLDEMEDEDDICLVYLTTHGFPILWDLPPIDEEDGMDEALACYRGFLPFQSPWSWEPLANPFGIITDDMINNNLNKLECSGLCIIVDSCHSGGFNDNWTGIPRTQHTDFAREFANDLQGRNRVIMTSVPEEDVSYGSFFSHYIAEGMKGYGDTNEDGSCSAEEAFRYAYPLIREYTGMEPQIFDDYPGELTITEKELPPSTPIIDGPTIGHTREPQTFYLTTFDPEEDDVRYEIEWGDGKNDMTELSASGVTTTIMHIWEEERTYNINIRAIDELGARSDDVLYHITMEDSNAVDQRNTGNNADELWGFWVNESNWCAQSFVPSFDKLTKAEFFIYTWQEDVKLEVVLRENLTGPSLAVASNVVPMRQYDGEWVVFNFDNTVMLTPGKGYYLICRGTDERAGVLYASSDEIIDSYENGMLYVSWENTNDWMCADERWHQYIDALFVTYG